MELNRLIRIFSVVFFCFFHPSFSQFTGDELIYSADELGKVRGSSAFTTRTRRPFAQILGIPYVEPLTEADRFLPPQDKVLPLAPDGDVFNATRKPACCPQARTNLLCLGNQKEDCLGMNIYTPVKGNEEPSTKLLPVIVFIHGGAFTIGSGDTYGGNVLLERDLVLVNFNYRLGTLGFFNLNINEAPGNAAMYDMVAALKFVKKHIQHFGGDPNRITLAGQSAGSVAVTHMMLSPLTKNESLFHRVIGMSGSALCEWGTTTPERAEAASLEVAQLLGCYNTSNAYEPQTVVACMRTKPAADMVATLQLYQRSEYNQGRLGFDAATPAIQRVFPGEVAFLDERPEDILDRQDESDVPLMMGSVRHDGSFVLGIVYNQFLRFNDLQDDAVFLRTQLIPRVLQALGIEDKTGAVFDALANQYMGKEAKMSGNLTMMIPGLTDLHTVFYFKAASFRTLTLHSRHHPNTYWYDFDFRGSRSVYNLLVNTTGNPVRGGLAHGDDILYLFNVPLYSMSQPNELAVRERLVNYWANFAATGNPNMDENGKNYANDGNEWPVFSEDQPYFARIDTEDTFINDMPTEYWIGVSDELYPGINPEDPTTPAPVITTDGGTTTPRLDTTTDHATLSHSSFFLVVLTVSFIFVIR